MLGVTIFVSHVRMRVEFEKIQNLTLFLTVKIKMTS